jgi:hypothetical protein
LHSPVEPAGVPAGACAKLLAASSIPADMIVIVDSDFMLFTPLLLSEPNARVH